MRALLLGMIGLFTLTATSQSIKIDSKEYETLKSQGLITNQTILNDLNPTNTSIHYTGKSEKSGVCDCLIPLDSTFMLAMAPNDDLYSNSIYLPFSFSFYGTTYDSLYINNNGNISFTMPYNTFTAFTFPDPSFNMIAPFWADVDTRSTNGGNVWYKLNPHSLVIVWDHVGYFSMMEDKLNTFQLIISDGQDTLVPAGNNVSFCYGDMQWTTGSASGGVNGFSGSPATVGVNIGNGLDYFQVGQFDTLGTAFDGPYNTIDQVDFLDNQEIYFNLASSATNIPPLVMSSLICDTIDVYTGDTLHKSLNAIDFTIGVSTPEIGQLLNTTIQCSLPSALSYVETPNGEFTQYDVTFDATNVQPGMYSIEMDVTDNGVPAQTVHKSIPIRVIYDANLSGLSPLSEERLSVYPNPASTILNIDGMHAADQIRLLDLQGKIVLDGSQQSKSLDISELEKGVYLLRVTREGKHVQTIKILKD
ncbi:MAG: nidogen-like domain-containing protein [Flavobacteriia bacterium]